MNEKIMLLYPPGKLFQRGEDRCQTNIDESTAASVHACNDLGYCASVLRNEGYEVFLRDYQTERKGLPDVINDVTAFRPDMIFLSTTNGTIYDDLDFINEICRCRSCVFVIKGAIFFDADLALLASLDLQNVSCCVGGEVEFIIDRIAAALLRDEGELNHIPGIIFHTDEGWKKTACDYFEKDIDSLPFPARDLMNNAIYTRPDTDEPMATISVARGCPSNCIYCMTPIISGRRLRSRSVENVFAEIEECYYKYDIKNFFFKADTFTFDDKFACALCDKIISSPLYGKIAFTANGRADRLTEEMLKKMKAAGCFMLAIGFESGSDRSLKLMKKGNTVETNLRAAKMIKRAGIPIFGFFMIGFPWENADDIAATEKLIFEIDPAFIELHIAMPYYGTRLYEMCKEKELLAAGSFGGDPYNPTTVGTEKLTIESIQQIRNRILRRFYLRPSYLFRRGVDAVKNPVIFKNYFRYGMRMLKNMKK